MVFEILEMKFWPRRSKNVSTIQIAFQIGFSDGRYTFGWFFFAENDLPLSQKETEEKAKNPVEYFPNICRTSDELRRAGRDTPLSSAPNDEGSF